ncbi:MAG: arylsulfatase A-like enzyme [Pseudohongiellaceae bacterium]|jgi:arylsulfatase A-like enzyme
MFASDRLCSLSRVALWAAIFAVGAAPGCGDSLGAGGEDRPPAPHGVVLVTLATLRADHLPWHGYPRNTAPFLASLAERSTVFLDDVSTASQTAPSHGSMLTGLFPSQHGVTLNGGEMSSTITTLPEILGAEGYDTAAFTSVNFLEGLSRGFEVFEDPGVLENDMGQGLSTSSHRTAADTVGAALQWLEQRSGDKPFFLWVQLFDVHEWKGLPVPQDVLDRLHGEDAAAGLSGAALVNWLVEQQGLDPDGFESEKQLGEALPNIDRYDGAIALVDKAVSQLFDGVSSAPGGDNVAWIVTADHGEGFTNHGLLGHSRHVYNEQLKVPLLVHGSHGRWPPAQVSGVVQSTDIVPTVIELCGATQRPTVMKVGSSALVGRSWLALLQGSGEGLSAGQDDEALAPGEMLPAVSAALLLKAAVLGERLAFSERRPMDDHQRESGSTGGEARVLQDDRYKLITHDHAPAEFYDIEADPLELQDLADAAPHAFMDYLQALSGHDQILRKQAAEIGPAVVDPEHLDELRRLGYVK